MTEIRKEIDTEKKDEKMYGLACRVADGHGGGKYVYCIEEDKFYIYENGYWQVIHDLELMARISKYIQINHITFSRKKQILDNLKLLKFERLNDFNKFMGLNLNNKMIEPLTGSTTTHNSKYLSTIRLNYNYDEFAPCPLWEKTLSEIFEKDTKKSELFQEFIGYCLTHEINQKKALLLLGDSNSGKSTLLFTLRALLGDKNCSSVPLEFLGNPQYTPMMINKMVNIDADVNNKAGNYESQFKIITSGEPVNCNQKFVATFEFIPRCKIILAANIFPKITDHSSAFYKRLILIPCDKIFEDDKQNKNLRYELEEELPGILNWALKGLIRLKKRGTFQHHDFMKNLVKDLEDENNPVNLFFEEHIEIEKESEIEKGDIYDRYKSWADRNNQYPLSAALFSTCLYKKYKSHTPKDTQNHARKRVWRNIKYVDFKGQHRGELIDYQN